MSDIKKNLEIILNIKDIESRIKSLENKAPIVGKTSIAVQPTPSGNNTSTSGGSSGGGASDGSNTDGSDGSNWNGGNDGDNSYTGGGNSSEVDGDGETSADPASNSVRDAEDFFDNVRIGDRLDALTGAYDCETGNELELSPNGNYIPPDEWQSINDNIYRDWTLGSFYIVDGPYITPGSYASLEQAANTASGYVNEVFGYSVTDVSYSGNGNYRVYLDWSETDFPQNTGWADAQLNYTSSFCFSEGIGLCPGTNPTKPFPTGLPTKLAFKNGRWQSHESQTDVSGKYKAGMQSSMEFCFGDDLTRKGVFVPSRDGGTIAFEHDGAGNAINDAIHFNANGVADRTINKNEIDRFSV